MTTTNNDLQTVADHLIGSMEEHMPPYFKSPEMAAVLDALANLTNTSDMRNPARLGLMVAELLTNRLRISMAAEREAAQAIGQHGLH